ncbi:MAG: MFS transporter [Gemmataceae bacterium]
MPRSSSWKWWVCGWLLFATMILYMDRLVLTQQEASIRTAFGIEKDDLYYGLLDSAFSVAFAFGALLAGWIADRWSVRLLYPVVVLLWSLTGGVTGLITGYWVLFGCRFFLGFFESGHWPCALKTSQKILEPSERTLGNGILQSGAAIGSVVTPLVLLGFAALYPSWRPPFLFIGFLGVLWVIGWFLLFGHEHGQSDGDKSEPRARSAAAAGTWWDILKERRFWVLVIVVICINSTWHFFRVWMPVILRQLHGFNQDDVQEFSIGYYVAADAGSLLTGFISLWLVRRGLSVHGSRMTVFAVCAGLSLFSLVAVFVPGNPLFLWLLPLVAFGSLGLFPVYYSFTQELTVRDQGKVTGTLGFICWMVMAALRAGEGLLSDAIADSGGSVVDRYAPGLILAGIMPLIAVGVLIFFWPAERRLPAAAAEGVGSV